MPHPDVEHGLQIQLATALRELEEEKALAMRVGERAWTAEAERDELKEALAAARRECAKKDEALDRCHDLFSDIRGDWTDPRSQCREGMAVCRAALAAPGDGEEKS